MNSSQRRQTREDTVRSLKARKRYADVFRLTLIAAIPQEEYSLKMFSPRFHA